ncbi:hypothetical protein lerEdw1_015201 [Lerista edwardsae]|nr:hypothetical protein lerEdw1_015203 [Lerista edwardsae]KAJ6611878.1 hypothetical protein lerEdw1_015201 [Lerista edwardsae]
MDTTIEILEQEPMDEEVFSSRRSSISRPQKMTMTTRPSSPLPEPSMNDGTLFQQADNELQGLQELIEERRKTLMETPDQLEERRKTLMTEIEGLEERRKTLVETIEGLEERRKTLMEASEGLEERRKTLMEASEGLEERRKTLVETIEGLEERRKTLMEVPEGLRERRKTIIEIPEAHGERRKTVIEIQEGLGERKKTLIETPEEFEERRKTPTEIPDQRYQQEVWRERKIYQSSSTVSRKASKKHKPEPPRVPSKTSFLMSWPPKTRYIPPKPKPETADKATQLRAIPVFPLRLTGPVHMPRLKTPAPKSETKSATTESGTQISRSFERLMKKPPPPLNKKKKGKYKTVSKIASSDTSSCFSKESRRRKSGVDRILKKKSQDIDRFSRSQKKCTALERVSRSQTKLTKPEVIYNFYVNICDCCREVDPCVDYPPCNWKECEPCAGLFKACAVFSTLDCGRICVSDLLMTLHTLGILVTHSEMQQTLQCIRMDGNGMVDFSEFLEVVNQTSPFAETDALQNALRAFRKIKKGLVPVRDLESVLENLGVELPYADLRQILKSPRVCKVDKVDLSNFFMAAKELDSLIEDEEVCPADCTIWERKPFQDVSNLVSANARWRRKYDSCDEDICGPWTCPDDDIATDREPERLSWIPIAVSTVSSEDTGLRTPSITIIEITPPADDADQGESDAAPVHTEEAEHKEGDIVEVMKPPADEANQEKPKTESIHNIEAEKKGGDAVTAS